MLTTVDAIPWKKLSHAYGKAADVQDLLRELASAAPARRQRGAGRR